MSDQHIDLGGQELQIAVGYTTAKEVYDFLGFKPDRGHIALLTGKDAVNFLEICRQVEADRALKPGAEGAETFFRLRRGHFDLGPVKLNMGAELPALTGSEYTLDLLRQSLQEVPEYSDQVKTELLERMRQELEQAFAQQQAQPGASLQEKGFYKAEKVQVLSAESAGMADDPEMLQRGDQMIANTKEQTEEIGRRVYLDFIDKRSSAWATAEDSPVLYDTTSKRYYLDYADAVKPDNAYHVARCRHKMQIFADDWQGQVTPGKVDLASAINEGDLVKQQFGMAKALGVCAAEAAGQTPGSFMSFSEVLKADKLIGRRFNFFTAFKRAYDFYSAENKLRKAQAMEIRSNQTGSAARQQALQKKASMLKRKAEMTLYKQAAHNVIKSAAPRTVNLLKNGGRERYSYVARVFSDYVQAKAEYDCKRLDSCFFTDKFPLHQYDRFAVDFLNLLADRGLDVTHDQELKQFVGGLLNRTDDACRRLDAVMAQAHERFLKKSGPFKEEFTAALRQEAEKFKQEIEQCYQLPKKEETAALKAFDPSKEPLYLVIPANERALLLKNNPEICCDLKNGFLCVENTQQNRIKFAAYRPDQTQPQVKLSDGAALIAQRAGDALRQHGFSVTDLKLDGRWQVDPRDKSRSYVINLDGKPRMQLRDFNGSLNVTVMLGEPSQSEKAELKVKFERETLTAKAIAEQRKEQCSAQLRAELGKLDQSLMHGHSPYLEKKGVPQEVLGPVLCDEDGSQAAKLAGAYKPGAQTYYRNALVLPLVNAAGKIMSTQIINEDGEKIFAKGTSVKGSFYPLGGYEHLKSADSIMIAEGIATAGTIAKYAPDNVAVVACMDCTNMQAVTQSLLAAFPDKGLALMADNDVKTADVQKVNPGMAAAGNTVKQLQAVRSHIPVFAPPLSKKDLLSGLSDFNDADKVSPLMTKARVTEAVRAVEQSRERMLKARSKEQLDASQVLAEQARAKAAAGGNVHGRR